MQYRFSLTRKLVRSLAVLALLLPLQGARAEGPDGARIVNGLSTHDLPTVAVLLSDFLGEAEFAIGFCSGTLIGCQTVLTAAHCVDGETASENFVFLQNVGTVSVSSITIHPSYMGANFPIADVAVLKLGSLVTGVDPTEINQIDPSSVIPGASGTIAGYGITLGSQNDFGLKRFGRIKTANCNGSIPAGAGNTEVICWDYETPVGSPGDDSNTCNGDSGGPLFMDLGAGNVVAGTTSGGFVDDCDTDDHSYNANVYTYRSFILSELGADSTSTCGSLAPVDDPNTIVLGNDGTLGGGNLEDSFNFVINPNTPELRVTLNTEDTGSFDADLYLRFGAAATSSTFDCAIDINSPYGGCTIASPSAGTWHVLIDRDSGSGDYQVTTTIFGGDPPVCGNGILETGEDCDDGNTVSGDGCPFDCQALVVPTFPEGGLILFGALLLGVGLLSLRQRLLHTA